jgi:hypothetical protein
MGHSHGHPPDHAHDHAHTAGEAASDGSAGLTPALDLSIPDAELSPAELGRRGFLRRAGLLGGAVAAGSVVGAAGPAAAGTVAGRESLGGYRWLAGDHHIHTQYSSDAMYRVADQVQHAAAYGLDWLVITDHGSVAHAKIGVEKVNPDIRAARAEFEGETLVFQGLEWNIPAAEHGTVFVHPGRNEVAVLKEFENSFDGTVRGWRDSTAANELHALEGLDFLAAAVTSRRVDDAMFLANHPARQGLDSPHEIRAWRERQPRIALGMEGAPGHQAAGLPKPFGPGSARGFYASSPSANSFPGYPLESYVTYGGFDWMTSTVGGLWDSLLAEGKPWWITANSDAHTIWLEDAVRGPNSNFDANGKYEDPVHGTTGPTSAAGDFWPGYYSRTHVGATRFSYAAVMQGLRAGRVWVDHGRLLDALDVRVRFAGDGGGSTLGSVVTPRRGRRLALQVTLRTATLPNWAQFVPKLAHVDVVRGAVTGPSADKDSITAPDTKVVKTFDVSGRTGQISLSFDLGVADKPFYLRLRGSDGKRLGPGLNGAAVDPAGPVADVMGNADPWADLWFYTNPIWVVPGR